VSFLLPNIEECKAQLESLCVSLNADEVILFERSTFLVIAHHNRGNYADEHRFEKISNIIKQFKLSCIKTNYKFDKMAVKNEKFSAFVEGFTNSTYIMVVTSDESVQYEAISMNIKATRGAFTHLLKSSHKTR
jgi:Ras-related GTP-binding protein A/B